MQKLIYVGLAGLLGTLGRYFLTSYVARRYGETFPYGTLVVNVAGCFLVGLLFQLTEERFDLGETWRAAVFVGFLGGFTTFSAYGLQTFALLRDGQPALAAANVLASNLAGLLMVWAGYSLAKLF